MTISTKYMTAAMVLPNPSSVFSHSDSRLPWLIVMCNWCLLVFSFIPIVAEYFTGIHPVFTLWDWLELVVVWALPIVGLAWVINKLFFRRSWVTGFMVFCWLYFGLTMVAFMYMGLNLNDYYEH